jgi:tetratricopeptide (TPR) repeat protein
MNSLELLEEAWRNVTPFLDIVLELEPEERPQWLADLQAREPAIAEQVRTCLLELEQVEEESFLATPVVAALDVVSLAGERYGSYTLDEQIGHGGTGTVWLAHRSDGRFVGQAAVKLLSAALVGHPSARRFAREGSVLARLRHPNIAQLLDAGVTARNQPYLVLEYVRGERIDLYCDKNELQFEQRIRLFLDVLAAVAHAHRNLIVHRDLKPPNILVTQEGVVKLLDFGVAALLSPTERATLQLTHHAAPGLTPGFAAPEQLRGEVVTTATDVYSLGVVLFMLLVGQHPTARKNRTAEELRRLTLETEVPRASDFATDPRNKRLLRGDLDNIISMSLRKNPAERYSTIEFFAQDLRRYLSLEPVSARPQSFRYLATKFVRRHRAGVAVACGVAVVLIGAMAVTLRQMADARRQRDEARYQSRRVESSDEFLKLLMLSDFGPRQAATTLNERLELGIQLLDKQYADDPKFAGRMLVELAEYFTEIQETRRADELYARAYDIGRQKDDPELMAYAACHRIYGEVSADTREGIADQVRDVQRLLQRIEDPNPVLRVACLAARAHVERASRHLSEAEGLLRQALNVLEADGSRRRPDMYVAILSDLGGLYLALNEPQRALEVLERAGEMYDRSGRGGTIGRLAMRSNSAAALTAMGEPRAALAERELIDQRAREIVSSEHELLIYPLIYSTTLLRLARTADALTALDGILERARRTGHRPLVAQALINTASAYTQAGRWDEVDALLKEAESLTGGTGNRTMHAQVEAFRARLDMAHGDPASAQRDSALSLQLAGYQTERPERNLARLLLNAAELALARGAASDAEQFSNDALVISESIARGPDTSADVGEALLRLVQARKLRGVNVDSTTLLKRSELCLTNGLGPDHPLTVEARALLRDASS